VDPLAWPGFRRGRNIESQRRDRLIAAAVLSHYTPFTSWPGPFPATSSGTVPRQVARTAPSITVTTTLNSGDCNHGRTDRLGNHCQMPAKGGHQGYLLHHG